MSIDGFSFKSKTFHFILCLVLFFGQLNKSLKILLVKSSACSKVINFCFSFCLLSFLLGAIFFVVSQNAKKKLFSSSFVTTFQVRNSFYLHICSIRHKSCDILTTMGSIFAIISFHTIYCKKESFHKMQPYISLYVTASIVILQKRDKTEWNAVLKCRK